MSNCTATNHRLLDLWLEGHFYIRVIVCGYNAHSHAFNEFKSDIMDVCILRVTSLSRGKIGIFSSNNNKQIVTVFKLLFELFFISQLTFKNDKYFKITFIPVFSTSQNDLSLMHVLKKAWLKQLL